jgi:hypothetical protein
MAAIPPRRNDMPKIRELMEGKLASSVAFGNGEYEFVAAMGVNDDGEGPEAVCVFFEENLDSVIPHAEKKVIADALIALFNYAQREGVVGKDVVGRVP